MQSQGCSCLISPIKLEFKKELQAYVQKFSFSAIISFISSKIV